jgi:predicted nucleic acid-binding protein
MIYLDTSAAAKLVVPEQETAALEAWIAEHAHVARASSRLLRVELMRTVRRHAPTRVDRANLVLSGIVLLSIDDASSTAETIGEPALRSLDAIHLATAYGLRGVLTSFVAYDRRLIEGAKSLGLPVTNPGDAA